MYERIDFYQQITTPTTVATPTTASAFDAATTAWVAAVFAVDGTVVTGPQATLVDNLIVGLKADALFAKLDRLWLFAIENQTEALVDIIANSLATAVNTPTFTINRGFASDGNAAGTGTSYINSNFNPSVGGFNYVQDSATLFGWVQQMPASTVGALVCNTSAGTQGGRIYPYYDLGGGTFDVIWGANAIGQSLTGSAPGTAGLYASTRTASNAQQFYISGSLFSSNATASNAIDNQVFEFLRNPGISVEYFASTGRIAAGGFGSQLSATEHANLNSRLQTYMTGVGA